MLSILKVNNPKFVTPNPESENRRYDFEGGVRIRKANLSSEVAISEMTAEEPVRR